MNHPASPQSLLVCGSWSGSFCLCIMVYHCISGYHCLSGKLQTASRWGHSLSGRCQRSLFFQYNITHCFAPVHLKLKWLCITCFHFTGMEQSASIPLDWTLTDHFLSREVKQLKTFFHRLNFNNHGVDSVVCIAVLMSASLRCLSL